MYATPFATGTRVFKPTRLLACLLVGAIMALSPSRAAAQTAPAANPDEVVLTPDECTVEVELTSPTLRVFTAARVLDDVGRRSSALRAVLNTRAGTLTLMCAPAARSGDYAIDLTTRTGQAVRLDLAIVVELPADEPPVIARVSAPEEVAPATAFDVTVSVSDDNGLDRLVLAWPDPNNPTRQLRTFVRLGGADSADETVQISGIPVGVHEVRVIAVDQAQNQSEPYLLEVEGVEVVAADETPPVIQSVDAPEQVAPGEPFEVTVSVSDDGGLSTIFIRYPSATRPGRQSNRILSVEGQTTATEVGALNGIPAGLQTLQVRATDAAGNATEPYIFQVEAVAAPESELAGVSLADNTLNWGQGTTGTITLAGPAPVETTVSLDVSGTTRSRLGMETSVTIPEGASSANFVISTDAPNPDRLGQPHRNATVTVEASLAGTQVEAGLSLFGPPIQIFAACWAPPTSTQCSGSQAQRSVDSPSYGDFRTLYILVKLTQPAGSAGYTFGFSCQGPSFFFQCSRQTIPEGEDTGLLNVKVREAYDANKNLNLTIVRGGGLFGGNNIPLQLVLIER